MTISNTKAKSVYETNGERREWEIGFDFDSNVSKLNIILEDSEGYQTVVEDNYLIEDGVVVYPSLESELDPVAEGYKIILIRETANNQEIDYRDNLFEQGLDKLTLQVQEIAEEVDRAIKVPVSEEGLSDYKNPVLEIREETKKSLNEIKEATSIVADYAQVSSSNAVTSKQEADRAVEASNVSVMASSDAEAFATKAENLANEAHNAVSAYVNGLGAMRNAVLDLGVFEENQRRTSSSIIDFDFEPLDVFVRFSDSEKKMWINGSHSFAGIEKVGDKKYKIFYSVSSEDFASQSAIKGPFHVQYVIKYSVFSGKPVMYRGRVDTVDQLPAEAEDGDLWYVGPIEQENKEEYVWQNNKWELLGSTNTGVYYTKEEIDTIVGGIEEEFTTNRNDIDELGDEVSEIESKIPQGTSEVNPLINKQQLLEEEMDIRADMMESDSELQTQINALAEAIQGGGGGSAEIPDNVYTEENFIAGENVTFDKKSGADDNTVGLFHFDGNAKDAVSGNELSENPVIATEGKFGTGSLKARENWFNSVSFDKSIDPKTTPFTLEFWHKQVAGSVMGAYGDETTIVLAPTAPNNTASKSQWVGLYMLPDGSNNRISLQIGDSRLGQFNTGSYTTLGQWNHYALTWDASTHYFKLYMNGTYVDQYQYYYYDSLPILGGIGMFKYTDGNDGDTKAQMYIDELRFSDTVRYTGNFTVATEAFPSDKLKTVVNVNVPEGGFNKDNLLGGKDIEIIPEPVEGGIDEHTVACWHFDGDLVDSISGTSANGTINTNNYKFGSSGLYSGKSNTISYPYTNNIGTLDFWFLKNGTAKVNFGFDCTVISNNLAGWIFRLNPSTNVIQFGRYNPSGSVWTVKEEKSYTFSSTEFIHLAAQRLDSLHYQLFVNGVLFMDVNADSLSGYSQKVSIESYSGGFFDEVRISDIARYNGDFTPPTQAYRLAVPTGRYYINFTGESGAGKNIGEVYYSQSSLATDNAGALPLFTGETIASADTIYPDFYKWVSEHTELQTSIQEYNKSIQDFGECPKYVLNGSETRYYWTNASYTNLGWQCYTLSATPAVGDVVWLDSKTGTFEPVRNVASVVSTDPYTWAISNETLNGGPVTFTGTTEADGVVVSLDDGSLRLPKKSLSHGTVIKEKKPTDIDPTWYRQWSDGWLEQGGLYLVSSISTAAITITMPKQFADIYYNVQITSVHAGTRTTQCDIENSAADLSNRTTNSFKTFNVSCSWEAKGQGADGAQDETLHPWIFAYNASVPASTAQAAEFQEGLSGKADTNLGNIPANYDYVVETYNDGTNWYRVYKSRWVEQGGIISGLTAAETKVVTFPKPFINEKYSVFWQYAVVGNGYIPRVTERTSTSFTMQSDYFATTYPVGDRIWRAEGQGA